MGNGKWDKVIKRVEKNVLVVKWKGNNQRFSLKCHITIHRDAQNNMEQAKNADDYKYHVPNQQTPPYFPRVHKDQQIVSAKAHIVEDPTWYSSFKLVVEYLLQVAPLESESNNNKSHNISGVTQGGGY